MPSLFTKGEEGETSLTAEGMKADTIIGPSVKVEGTLESDDNIFVAGEVVGTIKTTQDLTVGKDAHVQADVSAANMLIAGEVRGNLHAQQTVQLTQTSRVLGDVETQIISVETGAVLQGRCITGKEHRTEGATPPTPSGEKKK